MHYNCYRQEYYGYAKWQVMLFLKSGQGIDCLNFFLWVLWFNCCIVYILRACIQLPQAPPVFSFSFFPCSSCSGQGWVYLFNWRLRNSLRSAVEISCVMDIRPTCSHVWWICVVHINMLQLYLGMFGDFIFNISLPCQAKTLKVIMLVLDFIWNINKIFLFFLEKDVHLHQWNWHPNDSIYDNLLFFNS